MKRIQSFLVLLILFIPPLIFFTDLTRNPYYFQIVLLNGLTVLFWMTWICSGLREKKFSLRRTPIDLPLWSFFAAATLSWLVILFQNLHEPYLSYGIFNEGLKSWLFLLVNAVLVYYLAVNYVNDTNRRRLILVVFWVGWLASVYGILQYFGIEFFWPRVLNPFGGRSVSTFGNPNFLSSYLVLLIPVAYVQYLRANPPKQLFYLFMMFSFYTALLCTLTRSSLAGIFFAMAAAIGALAIFEKGAFWGRWRKNILVPVGAMLLLIVVWPHSPIAGYSPSVLDRLSEVKKAETTYYGAWHQRKLIWSCAWHMVIEKPVLGKGWGCFELFFPSYQGRHLFIPAYHDFRTHANNAHNEVLEIWSQTGTLGFGIYLWLLLTLGAFALFLMRNLRDEKRYLAIGLAAAVAGVWVDNLMNVSIHFAVPRFLYWWSIGLLVGLGKDDEKTVPASSAYMRALAVLLLLLGGGTVLRYARSFLGEAHYFNGFKLSKRNEVRRALPELEAAHALQRLEVNNNYELANCYARAGMRDRSLWGYREALRANAGYDEIYFNMATVLAQTGKTGEAVDEYTRSLYINPLSLEAYNALGTIFLEDIARYGKAGVPLLEQCARLYPANKDVWNNLGYLYAKLGRDRDALQSYRRAVSIDPDFALARKNLQITLRKLGETDPALSEIDTLFRQTEGDIVAKSWSSALAHCRRLVERVPESVKARMYLANIYFTLGSIPEAIAEYQAVLKGEPRNVPALVNLALAYYVTKEYAQSRQYLQTVLQIEPNNAIARQKLDEINRLVVPPQP